DLRTERLDVLHCPGVCRSLRKSSVGSIQSLRYTLKRAPLHIESESLARRRVYEHYLASPIHAHSTCLITSNGPRGFSRAPRLPLGVFDICYEWSRASELLPVRSARDRNKANDSEEPRQSTSDDARICGVDARHK